MPVHSDASVINKNVAHCHVADVLSEMTYISCEKAVK